jgi:anti-sigma factor RsiW
MTCREIQHLIVETLSGTAAPDQRRLVEAHLATCATCRADAAWVEQTMSALREGPEPQLRPDLWDGFMATLEARLAAEHRRPWARARRWFRQPLHAWASAAAAAVLVVGLGAALMILDRLPVATDGGPDDAAVHVMRMISPQVVEGIPAMDASLSVWKAGLGAGGVSYELTGGGR